MVEIVKVICKVVFGLLPMLWLISMWLYNKKGKWDKVVSVTTMALIGVGIAECICIAIGL